MVSPNYIIEKIDAILESIELDLSVYTEAIETEKSMSIIATRDDFDYESREYEYKGVVKRIKKDQEEFIELAGENPALAVFKYADYLLPYNLKVKNEIQEYIRKLPLYDKRLWPGGLRIYKQRL